MKQIFIVLLIAAIGAGAYFYFTKKQKNSPSNSKELILGKWNVDSIDVSKAKHSSALLGLLLAPDTAGHKYQLEFLKDGLILEGNEQKLEDTTHYKFMDGKYLLLWDKSDTAKTKWNIEKIDSTVLILKDQDSTSLYFQRVK
ncbi:MAG TPA: hypothetical protein VGQ09_13085 [Chitinophagaceae bacterium]|jgi:hypothetical protein|nr:hypothetical protein [Chitinophagaceae bacterium]